MHARRFAIAAVVLACAARPAAADPLFTDDTWRVRDSGPLAIDGGLFVGVPAGLPTGMSTGIGAGATWACGCTFAFGGRASWSTATEYTSAYTVAQWDLRLRATAEVRHTSGRGSIALRLGVGPTIVHESRDYTQGDVLGMSGAALERKAVDTLPAADLEAVIALRVAGPWAMTLSGGPSLDDLDGAAHWGWIAGLGVGWQP
jgi:hypothetical protein